MTPQQLDLAWKNLATKHDNFETTLEVSNLINDSINKWLDWYDANYNEWPTSEMPRWESLYNQTNRTLEAAIAQSGNRTATTVASSGPIKELDPISIWGRITKAQKKKLYVAGGILALLGIVAASKVRT